MYVCMYVCMYVTLYQHMYVRHHIHVQVHACTYVNSTYSRYDKDASTVTVPHMQLCTVFQC